MLPTNEWAEGITRLVDGKPLRLTHALLEAGVEAPLAARDDADAHRSYAAYIAESVLEILGREPHCSPCFEGRHHACEDDDAEGCCCTDPPAHTARGTDG